MKKILSLFLVSLTILTFCSCGGENGGKDVDVDLTVFSSTMAFSEACNMALNPSDHIGKTVKMRGQFSVFRDENTNQLYFACLIPDPIGCCQSQPIEFVLAGDYKYPKDYPPIGSTVTVVGEFSTYRIASDEYCTLVNAHLC